MCYKDASPLLLSVALLVLAFPAFPKDHEPIGSEFENRLEQSLRPGSGTIAVQSFSLPPGVTLERPLAENDAVAIALWNNAGLQATLSLLGLAKADLVEAGLLVNPDLQILFGIGSKPFELLLTAPIEALWQRPKRVAMAKLNLASVSQGLVQNGINLARDVRLAHAEYSMALARAQVSSEQADLLQRIADLTKKRLEAGDISRLDAQLVQLRAYTARDRAEQDARSVDITMERLRLLLGIDRDAPQINIAVRTETPDVPMAEDLLLKAAMSSRPDLRAAEIAIEAAGKRVGWERSRIFSFVAPMLSSKQTGTPLTTKTGPGLAIEIPIFNRNQGGIARAEAEVARVTLTYLQLADQVTYEVRDARARLLQARESLERLRTSILPEISQSIDFAEQAYENGDISYLDLQQASEPLLDVKLIQEETLFRVRSAEAELARAVGRKSL